jgi:hypothetical protein
VEKVKAKKIGLPHSLSKWVSLKAGSAFYESKRFTPRPESHPT